MHGANKLCEKNSDLIEFGSDTASGERESRRRERRDKRERGAGARGGSWAGPGPARRARARGRKWAGSGWLAGSIFFNKAFSFFFSLVLKLTIKP